MASATLGPDLQRNGTLVAQVGDNIVEQSAKNDN
jgi:myo-inositol-hexaphosphate 3-phosphohydrolase